MTRTPYEVRNIWSAPLIEVFGKDRNQSRCNSVGYYSDATNRCDDTWVEVARFAAERDSKKPAEVCDLLSCWFGGRWQAEWLDDEETFLISGTGYEPDRYDKARYFVIGYIHAYNAERQAQEG